LLNKCEHTVGRVRTAALRLLNCPILRREFMRKPRPATIAAAGILVLAIASASSPACATATTLKVTKRTLPQNDPGRFNLRIDGIDHALNVGNGGTTGLVAVSPGLHLVREAPANSSTNLCNYIAAYSGDCDATGHVTLAPGQHKSCVITNKLRTWTAKAPMPSAREYFGVGVINNTIYAVGGQPGWKTNLEMYDPATNTWVAKAPMPTGRTGLGVGVINGILYAVGGNKVNGAGGVSVLSTLEAYDPATDTWTTKASMPTPRDGLSVAVVNGILYAIGGDVAVWGTALDKVEAYNPVTNTWTTKAPMPTTRAWTSATVLNNRIYIAGGRIGSNSSGPVSAVHAYQPSTNSWSTKPSMSTARWGVGLSMVNGKIYVVGDWTKNEVFNPANVTWFAGVPMPTAREFLSVAAVNGVIYAMGGWNPGVGDTGKVEAFEACQ
jgi:N-acetylneuraminic acid mutarotase